MEFLFGYVAQNKMPNRYRHTPSVVEKLGLALSFEGLVNQDAMKKRLPRTAKTIWFEQVT
jgi:hypothetical protein